MVGPRVVPKARLRTGSGRPSTSFLAVIGKAVDGGPSPAMTGKEEPESEQYRPLALSAPKRSSCELFADHAAICHDAAQAGYGR